MKWSLIFKRVNTLMAFFYFKKVVNLSGQTVSLTQLKSIDWAISRIPDGIKFEDNKNDSNETIRLWKQTWTQCKMITCTLRVLSLHLYQKLFLNPQTRKNIKLEYKKLHNHRVLNSKSSSIQHPCLFVSSFSINTFH